MHAPKTHAAEKKGQRRGSTTASAQKTEAVVQRHYRQKVPTHLPTAGNVHRYHRPRVASGNVCQIAVCGVFLCLPTKTNARPAESEDKLYWLSSRDSCSSSSSSGGPPITPLEQAARHPAHPGMTQAQPHANRSPPATKHGRRAGKSLFLCRPVYVYSHL